MTLNLSWRYDSPGSVKLKDKICKHSGLSIVCYSMYTVEFNGCYEIWSEVAVSWIIVTNIFNSRADVACYVNIWYWAAGIPFDKSVFILFLYPKTFSNNPRSPCVFDLLVSKQIRETLLCCLFLTGCLASRYKAHGILKWNNWVGLGKPWNRDNYTTTKYKWVECYLWKSSEGGHVLIPAW